MNNAPSWQYNEFQQVGKDYGRPEEVEVYDSSHANFRDIEEENNEILDKIAVKNGDVVIDFGAGTGAFAIAAARRGASVYAVDVSEAMLSHAKARAEKAGISNITFLHGGFLTYEHAGTADAVVTSLALHHLPDFWKGIALKRVHAMLKPGGKLWLTDVILQEDNALENIAAIIERQAALGGDFLREDAEEHFREEYSTYDWVMDGLLTRAGFRIEEKNPRDGILASYLCVK